MTTATTETKTAKKAPFVGASRGPSVVFSPDDVAIMGGLDLPEAERGRLDTTTDLSHPLYDERLSLKLTKEWINSIFANGVKSDIELTLIGGIPFVVNGRQRVRGARIADKMRAKEELPRIQVRGVIVKLEDNDMLRDMVITNVHQEDTTAVKIAKLKRMLERGITIQQAASDFAVKPATIKMWLAYDQTAIPGVKAAVDGNQIPSTTGMDIARLPADKQQTALDAVMAIAAKDPDKAPTRGGHASKAKRAIATAVGKNPGISDKKTMKRFLEAVEGTEHPKNTSAATLEWWSGVEATLHFILGSEDVDSRLTKVLAGLDAAPLEIKDTPKGKKGAKKAAPDSDEE